MDDKVGTGVTWPVVNFVVTVKIIKNEIAFLCSTQCGKLRFVSFLSIKLKMRDKKENGEKSVRSIRLTVFKHIGSLITV